MRDKSEMARTHVIIWPWLNVFSLAHICGCSAGVDQNQPLSDGGYKKRSLPSIHIHVVKVELTSGIVIIRNV